MPGVKAYAVQETCEGTGGIVFAQHAVVARRQGASIYGDGDFSGVTCQRAPWADEFAERGSVPASAAIWAGWWFECTGCGRRIDEDLPSLWEGEVAAGAALCGEQLRYAKWSPEDVVGDMDTIVFCRPSCEAAHNDHEAERVRRQFRAIEAFKRIILARFPDAVIPDDEPEGSSFWNRAHHARAEKINGRWRLSDIRVTFAFPGMVHGTAALEYRSSHPYRGRSQTAREQRKPTFYCCNGDREAFEAWAGREALA